MEDQDSDESDYYNFDSDGEKKVEMPWKRANLLPKKIKQTKKKKEKISEEEHTIEFKPIPDCFIDDKPKQIKKILNPEQIPLPGIRYR